MAIRRLVSCIACIQSKLQCKDFCYLTTLMCVLENHSLKSFCEWHCKLSIERDVPSDLKEYVRFKAGKGKLQNKCCWALKHGCAHVCRNVLHSLYIESAKRFDYEGLLQLQCTKCVWNIILLIKSCKYPEAKHRLLPWKQAFLPWKLA